VRARRAAGGGGRVCREPGGAAGGRAGARRCGRGRQPRAGGALRRRGRAGQDAAPRAEAAGRAHGRARCGARRQPRRAGRLRSRGARVRRSRPPGLASPSLAPAWPCRWLESAGAPARVSVCEARARRIVPTPMLKGGGRQCVGRPTQACQRVRRRASRRHSPADGRAARSGCAEPEGPGGDCSGAGGRRGAHLCDAARPGPAAPVRRGKGPVCALPPGL